MKIKQSIISKQLFKGGYNMSFIHFSHMHPNSNNCYTNKRMSDHARHDSTAPSQSQPLINIKQNDEGFIIELAAPGLGKEDFKLKLDKNMLTILGEKKKETNPTALQYTKQEFSYGDFSRSFTLPQTVDSDKITAAYHQGILTVSIPNKDESKMRIKKTIDIQ